MNTDGLRTFLLVSKLKNFTRVAEQLFIAQSTVDQSIAELEKELSAKLLRRDTRNVALTEQGKAFCEYAPPHRGDGGCLYRRHQGRKAAGSHRAVNAVYEGALKQHILAGVEKGKYYRVTIGHSSGLLEMLWDGLLDVVYVYQDMRRSGYSCKLFNEDDLVFLARADRNAFPNGIRREQLFEIPCAMCNFSLQEIGSYLRELFPAGQLFPFEVDNSTKVKDFLAAGLGYAFLPRGMVREELENGTFAEIQPLDFKRMNLPCYCICRTDDEDLCF